MLPNFPYVATSYFLHALLESVSGIHYIIGVQQPPVGDRHQFLYHGTCYEFGEEKC